MAPPIKIKPSRTAGPISQHKRLAMGKAIPKAKVPKGLERL